MSLNVYKNMLNEEIDRKRRALKAFELDIINNDRKPIYIKKVKDNVYVYINDGEKGNFHYKLLGNKNSFSKSEYDKLKINSDKYNENIKSINEIKEDINKLERMVKILG